MDKLHIQKQNVQKVRQMSFVIHIYKENYVKTI